MLRQRVQYRACIWLAVAAAFGLCLVGCEPSIVKHVSSDAPHHDFDYPHAADVVTIHNAHLAVAVSPKLGRVVGFSSPGEPNVLWVGTERDVQGGWKNYGGDKVWPSPQADWPQTHGKVWPPTPGIDGPAWRLVASSPKHIIIESPISQVLGIKVQRAFTLMDDPAYLQVNTTVTRAMANDARVHVWPITQLRPPQYVLLDVQQHQPDGEPVTVTDNLPETLAATKPLKNDVVRFDPPQQGHHKIGSYGYWTAAVFPKWVFVQDSDAYIAGESYADSSSVQVFSCPRYVELEATGPVAKPVLGESIELMQSWYLVRRDPAMTPEVMVEMIAARRDMVSKE